MQTCTSALLVGGVTRMTISITVLVMEITGGLQVTDPCACLPSAPHGKWLRRDLL